MQLRITHQLCYRYDRPVFFEPTLIRLCPRHDHIQRLLDFNIEISPAPAGATPLLDAHDNRATMAWFNDMHEQMEIQSTARLQMMPSSPFDYLVTDPGVERLPAEYPRPAMPALASFRTRSEEARAIDALAEDLRQQAEGDTLEFLRRLVLHIPNHCTQIHREEGAPWPASRTLERGEGSCRDLTLLFMEACRAVGLAARFVSGYCSIESLHEKSELHAWAEVYLPGGGWRGYDPTLGLATSHEHIALATGADPADAAPTDGSYRGTDATSQFEYAIWLHPETD